MYIRTGKNPGQVITRNHKPHLLNWQHSFDNLEIVSLHTLRIVEKMYYVHTCLSLSWTLLLICLSTKAPLVYSLIFSQVMDETSDTGSKSGTAQAIPGQLALMVEYEVSSLTTHSAKYSPAHRSQG